MVRGCSEGCRAAIVIAEGIGIAREDPVGILSLNMSGITTAGLK